MKNLSILTLLYKSCYSFKDIAKFRFMDIGKTFKYVFLLIFIYFLPTVIKMLVIDKKHSDLTSTFDGGSLIIILPIYIIGIYILYTGIIFVKISFLAWLAQLIAKSTNRSLPYRNSWRLVAFSITFPTILFGILPLFNVTIPYAAFLDVFIALIYIFCGIQKMPVQKRKHSS